MIVQAKPDSWLSASSSDDESSSDDDNLLILLLDSSSEDEAELLFSQRGGSCPGKKPKKIANDCFMINCCTMITGDIILPTILKISGSVFESRLKCLTRL